MNSIFQKLFFSNYYFTIAIRRRDKESILNTGAFSAEYVHPATAAKWSADPILAEEDGRTWLFYEAVENNIGHIEVAEVLDDCSLGTPTVILGGDCHYSYPFVFQWDRSWYMIPESSAAKEVRLYRAEHFPTKWTLQEILLRERAVDTTVFAQNGKLFLLTFLTDGTSERVRPLAYELSLERAPRLRRIEWTEYDELKVRGAGPILTEEDQRYRPAQISREYRYGDAVAFYRMNMQADHYREEPVQVTLAPCGRFSGHFVLGGHTYCRSANFEAMDYRCRTLDICKLPQRILRRLRK